MLATGNLQRTRKVITMTVSFFIHKDFRVIGVHVRSCLKTHVGVYLKKINMRNNAGSFLLEFIMINKE